MVDLKLIIFLGVVATTFGDKSQHVTVHHGVSHHGGGGGGGAHLGGVSYGGGHLGGGHLGGVHLGGVSYGGGHLGGGTYGGGHLGGGVHHGGSGYHAPAHQTSYYAPAHYTYDYGVHDDYSGTNFGHSEARDGYKTEGKYYVHLPDGRIQTVSYYADEYGYHPHVSYEGVAHYPHAAPVHHGGYH